MSIFIKITVSLLPLVASLGNVPLSDTVGQSPRRVHSCVTFPPSSGKTDPLQGQSKVVALQLLSHHQVFFVVLYI